MGYKKRDNYIHQGIGTIDRDDRNEVINVRVPALLKREFQQRCKNNHVQASEQIRVLIKKWLQGKQEVL